MEDETKTHIEEPKAQGEAVVVRERRNDGIIYVGKKGTMGYVQAVITQFNNGAPEVTIKARGNLISKSVDVAEIVRHRFMPSCQVKNISIKTEELASEDGSMSKVSAMEIILTK
ncbi:TPA: DNA-binding protein Alba [Candidatus Micrarchaeota archaeon]|nr:DNA-binding protein Alba [Candidatus Micrarchaeota archaeon]